MLQCGSLVETSLDRVVPDISQVQVEERENGVRVAYYGLEFALIEGICLKRNKLFISTILHKYSDS